MKITPFGNMELSLDQLPQVRLGDGSEFRSKLQGLEGSTAREREFAALENAPPPERDPEPDVEADALQPTLEQQDPIRTQPERERRELPSPQAETDEATALLPTPHAPTPKEEPALPQTQPAQGTPQKQSARTPPTFPSSQAEEDPKSQREPTTGTAPSLGIPSTPAQAGGEAILKAPGVQSVQSPSNITATAAAESHNSSRSEQSAAKPQEAKPSYASQSKQTLELAREHRDSIFRSIALSLSKSGGEIHLLLDPKELGGLSVQLKLDGQTLRVQVRAERSEVADALREDSGQLVALLEERGLNVEDLEVRTGSREEQEQEAIDFRRHRGGRIAEGADGTQDAGAEDPGLLSRSIGWQAGSGIDFIV